MKLVYYLASDVASTAGFRHIGVLCNVCGAQVNGTRYRDVNEVDFDLCRLCYEAGRYDPTHVMEVIDIPLPLGKSPLWYLHPWNIPSIKIDPSLFDHVPEDIMENFDDLEIISTNSYDRIYAIYKFFLTIADIELDDRAFKKFNTKLKYALSLERLKEYIEPRLAKKTPYDFSVEAIALLADRQNRAMITFEDFYITMQDTYEVYDTRFRSNQSKNHHMLNRFMENLCRVLENMFNHPETNRIFRRRELLSFIKGTYVIFKSRLLDKDNNQELKALSNLEFFSSVQRPIGVALSQQLENDNPLSIMQTSSNLKKRAKLGINDIRRDKDAANPREQQPYGTNQLSKEVLSSLNGLDEFFEEVLSYIEVYLLKDEELDMPIDEISPSIKIFLQQLVSSVLTGTIQT